MLICVDTDSDFSLGAVLGITKEDRAADKNEVKALTEKFNKKYSQAFQALV